MPSSAAISDWLRPAITPCMIRPQRRGSRSTSWRTTCSDSCRSVISRGSAPRHCTFRRSGIVAGARSRNMACLRAAMLKKAAGCSIPRHAEGPRAHSRAKHSALHPGSAEHGRQPSPRRGKSVRTGSRTWSKVCPCFTRGVRVRRNASASDRKEVGKIQIHHEGRLAIPQGRGSARVPTAQPERRQRPRGTGRNAHMSTSGSSFGDSRSVE
jgi:hypothetical protein